MPFALIRADDAIDSASVLFYKRLHAINISPSRRSGTTYRTLLQDGKNRKKQIVRLPQTSNQRSRKLSLLHSDTGATHNLTATITDNPLLSAIGLSDSDWPGIAKQINPATREDVSRN